MGRERPDKSSAGQPSTAAHFPIKALSPDTGGDKIVKLMSDLVVRFQKTRPASMLHEVIGDRSDPTTGSPVQHVLAAPAAIFDGVRDFQVGGTCYSGVPACAYTNGGAKIPPVPGKVFCVYVNPHGIVFEWRWEPADPDVEGLPLGYHDRFGKRLWPKQL